MLWSRPPKEEGLFSLVEAFWTCEIADGRGLESVLPNGCAQLFINLHEDTLHYLDSSGAARQRVSGMVVQGPTFGPILTDRVVQKTPIGSCSPKRSHPFLGIPMSEFVSELSNSDCRAWGQRRILQERLAQCRGPDTRLDLMEATPARTPEVQDRDVITLKVSHMLRKRWRVKIVADEFGTTQPTLIARFRKRKSLTPKTFSRIDLFPLIGSPVWSFSGGLSSG